MNRGRNREESAAWQIFRPDEQPNDQPVTDQAHRVFK
jgi:hypothetical protein